MKITEENGKLIVDGQGTTTIKVPKRAEDIGLIDWFIEYLGFKEKYEKKDITILGMTFISTDYKPMGLEKYEGDFFNFAEVFTATVRNGVVYLEEYSEGAFPLIHIKTEEQYLILHELLTGEKRLAPRDWKYEAVNTKEAIDSILRLFSVSSRYLSAEKAKQMTLEALKEMAAKEYNTKCVLEQIEEATQNGVFQIKAYDDNKVRDNLVLLGYGCSEPFESRNDIYMMVSWS